MNKFTEIFWILTVKDNQDMRFLQKIKETNEIDLETNKEIVDKLEEQNVEKIKFWGNEALNYPYFIELLKYTVQKGIKCELLFYNLFDIESKKFQESLKYLDSITLSIDSMNDKVNIAIGKEKDYFKKVTKLLEKLYDIDIKVNINTMTYSLNTDEVENLGRFFVGNRINLWRVFNFAPIFTNINADLEKIKLSKINYHHFINDVQTFCYGIKFFKYISDRVIENYFVTITPIGNAVMIFNNELYNVGSILNNKLDDIIKKFEKQKNKMQKDIEQKKITIFLGIDDDKLEEEIRKQLERLKYVEIIGNAKNGIDTYKKILELKPEMVFLEYRFSDKNGYNIIMEIADKLKLDTPIFNIIGEKDKNFEYEVTQMIKRTHKINSWIPKELYKNQFYEIVKGYKELLEL